MLQGMNAVDEYKVSKGYIRLMTARPWEMPLFK